MKWAEGWGCSGKWRWSMCGRWYDECPHQEILLASSHLNPLFWWRHLDPTQLPCLLLKPRMMVSSQVSGSWHLWSLVQAIMLMIYIVILKCNICISNTNIQSEADACCLLFFSNIYLFGVTGLVAASRIFSLCCSEQNLWLACRIWFPD